MRHIERCLPRTRPTRKFLVSNQQAYEVARECGQCRTFPVRHCNDKFDEDVISPWGDGTPVPGAEKVPREVAERIVAWVVRGFIDNREYRRAAQSLAISKSVLQEWWRWYSDGNRRSQQARPPVAAQLGQLSKVLFLLESIYDDAFVGEAWQRNKHIPSIGINLPAVVPPGEGIAPHDLVVETEEDGRDVHMLLRNDRDRRLEGLRKPLVMYAGPRLCDVMVGNVVGEEMGMYECDKVVFPVLCLRVQAATVQLADTWMHDKTRGYWRRLADLVRWSMEGCSLYVEGFQLTMIGEPMSDEEVDWTKPYNAQIERMYLVP